MSNQLTPLPPTSMPSGLPGPSTVSLYTDPGWRTNDRHDYHLDDFPPLKRHFVNKDIDDKTTCLCFNMPVGTVLTLLEHVPDLGGENPASLNNCGRCIDLVGTGQPISLDLRSVGMDDCVTGFTWRNINLNIGAIELFADPNFTGVRTTLFLSDWNVGQFVNINGWYMNDRVTSVRWRTLQDRQLATLFADPNGGGRSYSNIKGYGTTKELPDLRQVQFDDMMSCFQWQGIIPVKEDIKPFKLDMAGISGGRSVTASESGINDSSVNQSITLSFSKTTQQSMTVSSSDEFAAGIAAKYSESVKAGGGGIEASVSYEVSVTMSYKHTESSSKTVTETEALSYTIPVNIPPMTKWQASLVAKFGTCPASDRITTATRWYDVPVNGAVQDPQHSNWWKRDEEVHFEVGGDLAVQIYHEVKATPLN